MAFSDQVVCSQCGHPFSEGAGAMSTADRPSCPDCGGMACTVPKMLVATGTSHVSLGITARPNSGGPWFLGAVCEKLQLCHQLER